MLARAHIKSHPIHSMLVAFPIGLFITSFAFDLIGFVRSNAGLASAGWYCAVAGLFAGAAAAVAGATDLFGVVPPNSSARKRGWTHGILNSVVMVLFIASVVYRGGPNLPDKMSLILSGIGAAVLLYSGWLGGTLVYRNQIGVDHRYANAGKWKEVTLTRWDQPVCAAEEIANGQLVLVNVEGTRVAVGRCAEGIVAFSDHCTHSGGPLSDGALVGCTVQCPWHGSQFDVHTGRVVNGPADEKIETFSAEVNGGQVYVLPKGGEKQKAA